jgi:hypothetical protein
MEKGRFTLQPFHESRQGKNSFNPKRSFCFAEHWAEWERGFRRHK